MADGSRVPITISEFNDYLISTDNFLQAISSGIIHNWERLGMDPADATDWHNRRVYWHDTLYPKYQDPLQSTGAVKDAVRGFMGNFNGFAHDPLTTMAANNNATTDDENVFHFKIGRAAPSHPTTPFTESVVFDAKSIGGAEFQFSCRTSHDDHHASKAIGADTVQLAYLVQAKDASSPNLPPIPPNPPVSGDTGTSGALPNPDSPLFTKELFTTATFVKGFGMENKQKAVILYMRWYNTKYPGLAGPWSGPSAVVIS